MPRLRRVALSAVTFAAIGCHRNSVNEEIRKIASSEGVRFTAEATSPPDRADTVFLSLKATNQSRGYRTVMLAHAGKCGASVAFATGHGKATRIWRLESPPAKLPPNFVEVCTGSGALRFGPGASVESFHTAVPVRAILGDSLPAGLYRAVIGGNAQLRGGYVTQEIALR
jgi:hypothetical protein